METLMIVGASLLVFGMAVYLWRLDGLGWLDEAAAQTRGPEDVHQDGSEG